MLSSALGALHKTPVERPGGERDAERGDAGHWAGSRRACYMVMFLLQYSDAGARPVPVQAL